MDGARVGRDRGVAGILGSDSEGQIGAGHRAGRTPTTKCVAVWVCVLTTIALLAPVMLAVTVSVAVIVWAAIGNQGERRRRRRRW